MERPIIFSGEMVRAILEGRKTQTRRVIKPQPIDSRTDSATHDHALSNWFWADEFGLLGEAFKCPYGAPSDRLWVRETWIEPPYVTGRMLREGADTWPRACYRADDENEEELQEWGWRVRSPLHMPRWASRITLEITGVRVERLQDIDAGDAKAEGLAVANHEHGAYYGIRHADVWERDPRRTFERLWRSLHRTPGKRWDDNPWVWVIEFKRTDTEVSDE